LRHLRPFGTRAVDFAPLAGLVGSTTLVLDHTQAHDISPLRAALKGLKIIDPSNAAA